MAVIAIDQPDDPCLIAYRALPERALAREGDWFIAEGFTLVQRLLASELGTVSVLAARKRAERIKPFVPDDVPLYVAPDQMIERIVGFKFHSGVIACGRRPAPPTLASLIGEQCTFVVCPKIINIANAGAMMRIAAAFGATALLLGEASCDPFRRIALRASMGAAFTLPIVRSDNLAADLRRLRDEHDVELIAAVTDDDAQPLPDADRSKRIALLFGPEDHGLDGDMRSLCDRRVTIAMSGATDSLNIVSAASIMLYHFLGRAKGSRGQGSSDARE
jgi:tRNA G18 (ribose-2'-O)-methylase SpoU